MLCSALPPEECLAQQLHVVCASLLLQGLLPEGSSAPCVVINGKALTFSFALDALEVIAQLSQDFLPPLPNDKVRKEIQCFRACERLCGMCRPAHPAAGFPAGSHAVEPPGSLWLSTRLLGQHHHQHSVSAAASGGWLCTSQGYWTTAPLEQ
jgi:hypothetical protein